MQLQEDLPMWEPVILDENEEGGEPNQDDSSATAQETRLRWGDNYDTPGASGSHH